MTSSEKKSTTSVAFGAPVTDYADGIASFYVAPHFRRTIPIRKDGDIVSMYLEAEEEYLVSGEKSLEDLLNPEPKESEKSKKVNSKKSPTLMDISLLNKTVVYDAAGNPSATVVLKIRNSSGEPVVGIKALVTKR